MGLREIKARLAATIQAVSGVGKVYPWFRVTNRENATLELFVANGTINTWFVTRDSARIADADQNQALSEQKDNIVIHGYYGLQDAAQSEDDFGDLVDAVLKAVNADRRAPGKLNGLVEEADAPQVRALNAVFFGPQQALCHHVEIVLPVVWRYLQGVN